MTNSELLNELLGMRDIGIRVDDRTLNHAMSDDIGGYASMSVADLASLYCELYNWTHSGVSYE
jgi:hypothetical protein